MQREFINIAAHELRTPAQSILGYAELAKTDLQLIDKQTLSYIDGMYRKSQGDIRDVISIGKLVRKSDGPREIEQIMNTMAKYGNMMMQARGIEIDR